MPRRDSGGSFKLNNPDDNSPVREMFTLKDGLLLITEKCTYRMQVADQIDPERTNPSLPHNFQQKLFDHGTNSELLCRTFLQSKVLFRKEFQDIDIEAAMQLAFEALSDCVLMYEAVQTFKAAEEAAINKAKALEAQSGSLTIPAIGNVRGHCKTFIQKADHFANALHKIVRLFYPEMRGKNWEDFHQLVHDRYGETDVFSQVTDLCTPFLKLIRNARDCLEHGLSGVTTSDFMAEPNGMISLPWIEIDFRGGKHDRCQISWFMEQSANSLLDTFGMIITHTCAKSCKPLAGLPMRVGVLDENYQKAWRVKFAYGSDYANGQFVPCG